VIKIVDNFFSKKDLLNVQDFASNKAYYTPEYTEFDNTTERNKENFYGIRWHLNNDKNLKKLFIKQIELKFKIKINSIAKASGIDLRNLDHFIPHTDCESNLNALIMLKGPTAVSNGTVFYYGAIDDCVLDIHVGFRENRAILFPADWVHSPHAINDPSIKRYTASVFITDYD
tara:strand:+ start:189 stop:707 length:519 start_codon:yes stop_codon:yes gene_type:complete